GMYSFDCNDPLAGGGATGLFSAQISYGAGMNVDSFTKAYGAAQANYVIAASHNTAKIIETRDPEFTALKYVFKGFDETIAKSGGSQVIGTLDITPSDILANRIVPMIQATVLRFPQTTWLKSPYPYATLLGVLPALGTRTGHIHVMGGEGWPAELDQIRKGNVTAACVISPAWTGWAAVDTLNSVFRGQKPVDSG